MQDNTIQPFFWKNFVLRLLKNNLTSILLLLIICLAVSLRFYKLSSVPPSPSLDEVTTGYNAFSILNTGKDEYGYKFPLLLRAYDDFRPAGYVYLAIPFVKLLGLNILAVRLPAAIMSLLEVIIIYFLVELIVDNKEKKIFAFVSALLLAISPWHIYISRLGHEANAGLFTVIMAIFFFFLSIKKEKYTWMLIVSSLFFGLSLYAYQSEKVFSPFFAFVLFAMFIKDLYKNKKILIASLLVGILVALPAVKVTFSKDGMTRFSGTSAFSEMNKDYQASSEKLLRYKKQGNLIGQLVENRRLIPIKIFFSNYFSHLSPEWLYVNEGGEQFKVPGIGLFYSWESLLFLAGLFYCIRFRIDKRVIAVLLSWIGLSFIAPAITTQSPHAMRAFTLLPAPQIIEAIGFVGIISLSTNLFKIGASRLASYVPFVLIAIFLILTSYSSVYFFHQYFYVFPKEESEPFQYALHTSIQYVLNHKDKYKEVLFSNADQLTQSYMFYLFAAKYNPIKYLKEGGTKSGGFAEFHKYDLVDFRPIVWDKDRNIPGVLIVGNIRDFPAYAKVVYRGYYLDGKESVRIVEP